MTKPTELDYTQLQSHVAPEAFAALTAETPPSSPLPGQERAVQALRFGLQMPGPGYHIRVAGPVGTGRLHLSQALAREAAAQRPAPCDWCYVYNFANPQTPQALAFPAGLGRQFAEDIGELVETMRAKLQRTFGSETYEKEKTAITRRFDETRDKRMKEIEAIAKQHGLSLRSSQSGFFFMPVIQGEEINEEKYDALSDEEKAAIDASSALVQEEAATILRSLRRDDKAARQAASDLEYKVGMLAIGQQFTALQQKYEACPRVLDYLTALQEDALEHIGDLLEPEDEPEEGLSALIPALAKKSPEDILTNYGVNLMVDHSGETAAPVVTELHPSAVNLLGEVEYDNDNGNLYTNFMKLKAGQLHRANGGVLIVQLQELLNHHLAWEGLRRALKTGQLTLEMPREQAGPLTVPALKPEPIPLELKVVLIGSDWQFQMLAAYDDDFEKLFPVEAGLDYELSAGPEATRELGRFFLSVQQGLQLRPLTPEAMAVLANQAARLAERQDRFTACLGQLKDLLREADAYARAAGHPQLVAADMEQAIAQQHFRRSLYEEKLQELLEDNVMMIDTTGNRVGQINALTVLDMGDYAFGCPARITATTYAGRAGIVNIEKESAMSGPTHNKGVHILAGFLGQTYAQRFPLALSCQLCFEQSYNGIDGDSASSSELYCILSSLSGLPIRQDLANTGSLNQWGEIQAIGGVTQKIEGFFALCHKRGLTGKQGVLIPAANVRDLVLSDQVTAAVRDGVFHIYPISHVDEGMELLMGKSAQTIHAKVSRKLQSFYECQNPAKK